MCVELLMLLGDVKEFIWHMFGGILPLSWLKSTAGLTLFICKGAYPDS